MQEEYEAINPDKVPEWNYIAFEAGRKKGPTISDTQHKAQPITIPSQLKEKEGDMRK